MNDVERYEYAEKLVDLYKNTPKGGINVDAFQELVGDEEPSAEDQELILNLVRDMIQHENEIAGNTEESDDDQAEVAEESNA